MDRDLWRLVLSVVRRVARQFDLPGRRKPLYPDWLIVAMYTWSVWHDRCLSWACDRSHYGAIFRPRKLPSISQFSRRIKTEVCNQILDQVHEELVCCGLVSRLGYLDGKRLTVGSASKDPDAKRGKISGGFGKGYELHAYVNEHRRIVVWSLMPLNVSEQSVALELCRHLPPPAVAREELTLADSNYDSSKLYRQCSADQRALLTPLKGQARVDPIRGHHPVTLRQMGPARREALSIWKDHNPLARYVMKMRNRIENTFSVLACALNLSSLPAWVRRLDRVRRWVGVKIILYHARLNVQAQAANLAKSGA